MTTKKKKNKQRKKGCYNCGNLFELEPGRYTCRVCWPVMVIDKGRHAQGYNYCNREYWESPEV